MDKQMNQVAAVLYLLRLAGQIVLRHQVLVISSGRNRNDTGAISDLLLKAFILL
jgi:hypothetical protein